jgi:AcrR family transcriptional regulator
MMDMSVATLKDDTRSRLIAATLTVVRREGYQGTTTRAVAAEAGVAEGTIYRHFGNKRELCMAAVAEQSAPVTALMANLPSQAGTRTVRAHLVDALTELATLRDDFLPLEIGILSDPKEAAQRYSSESLATHGPPVAFHGLQSYLELEQRIGRIRTDAKAEQVAVVLLAAVLGFGILPLHPFPKDAKQEAEDIVELALRGLEL